MSVAVPTRVVIADDEPAARRRLEDFLKVQPGVDLVGSFRNGRDAVAGIRFLTPDIVFLDIQMPGLSGIDVVREVGPEHMPVTLFVTAYDRFAIRAFELNAIDYLLKPFEDERLEQAFDRARKYHTLKQVGELTTQLVDLLRTVQEPSVPVIERVAAGYLERIAVEMRGQVRIVSVEDVDYFVARGPYAEIHAGDATYVVREQMQTLETRLDPADFFRIHRSAIVRLDRVESLLNRGGGDCSVRLRGGAVLSVSRTRFIEFEQRLGLGAG